LVDLLRLQVLEFDFKDKALEKAFFAVLRGDSVVSTQSSVASSVAGAVATAVAADLASAATASAATTSTANTTDKNS
jgi:hypothetical protein